MREHSGCGLPTKGPDDILSADLDACGGMLLDEVWLFMSGNALCGLPALHGRGRAFDDLGDLASAAKAGEEVNIGHGGRMYDNVAQPSTNFSHILCASYSLDGPMMNIGEALRELRSRARPKLTVRDMADELGMSSSTYAFYESARFKKPVLPFDLAKKLSVILARRGVPEKDVLILAGVTGALTSTQAEQADGGEWVTVTGVVAAGLWREPADWSENEKYDVRFGPPPFSGAVRFGLRMEGLSMNRTIQPGSDLEVLRVLFGVIEPRPGDLVIVERHKHGLVETTCKRLDTDGDDYILRCESYEEEFQEVIRLGRPDPDQIGDDEIRVVGIVLSSKLDHARPGLSQRRYRSS